MAFRILNKGFGALLAVILASLLASCSSSGGGGSDSVTPVTATLSADGTVGADISVTNPPLKVNFDASGSTGSVTEYRWDFGDGSGLVAGQTVSHTYLDYGNFQVTLLVNNANGIVDSSNLSNILDGVIDVSSNPDISKATQLISVGYTVSGTVTGQPGSITDNDVNDPLAPYSTNDTPANAQAVPNPSIIGGFASETGTGIAGDRFESVADQVDSYRVTLGANQSITLSVSDVTLSGNTPDNDLDLFLYTASDPGTPVASSISVGSIERLSVPANGDGSYDVVVLAYRGSSSYVLTIGDTTVLNTSGGLSLEDEFVPGDVIVKFEDAQVQPSDNLLTSNTALQSRASSIGMQATSGKPGWPMLFNVGDEAQKEQMFSVLGIRATISNDAAYKIGDAQKQLKFDTIKTVKALRQRVDVETADLNYIRHPLAVPDDPAYTNQSWHYSLINLPTAWDSVVADAAIPNVHADVIVAVVDTGVFLAHPDLSNNLVDGYDFISDPARAADGDGRDANPDDPGDRDRSISGSTSSFHGTHVSGTIAAQSNNALGVAGVTWNTNTKIMPIRALGTGGGSSFDIMEGVKYAAGLSNVAEATQAITDARVAMGNVADVINLSIGGGSFSGTEQSIFNSVRAKGIIVVAAAGNSNSSAPSYPASYDGVVSVSAVDKTTTRASYSNFGQFVDVAAPGGDGSIADRVYSTIASDATGSRVADYAYLRGTSMATPHVAGVAALMKSVFNEPNTPGVRLTPDEFDVLLQAGVITDDVKLDGASVRNDEFGYGLINSSKAIAETVSFRDSGILPPYLLLSTTSFTYLEPTTTALLTTSNPGAVGGTFTLDLVETIPWLTVTPDAIDANKLGDYSVTVDRSGLADGQYQGSIVANYTGAANGSVTIPVTMQVGPLSTIGDTGFQYGVALSVDQLISDIGNPIISVGEMGAAVNGVYNYTLRGVGPGDYIVASTSDLDHDFVCNPGVFNCDRINYVCDIGESCGVFPFVFTVTNSDVIDLNFNSQFDQGVGTTDAGSGNESGLLPKLQKLLPR